MHGAGWWNYIWYDEKQDRPQVSWALIRRVLGYARPFRSKIILTLVLIAVSSLLGIATPLLFRGIINDALPGPTSPNGNGRLLDLLALGIIAVPILNGVIAIVQRYLTASTGEGVIHTLRVALYAHLQHMSLRFFTHTKTGELMSRLNDDVVGAQSAVTGTLVTIITNIFSVVVALVAMLSLNWPLTLIGLAVVPLFVLPARRVGLVLRTIARQQMEVNATMNAIMHETLNVSGALLVKLFGRTDTEIARFSERASKVRDIGIRRAVVGGQFFVFLGLIGAVGTTLVYWYGGHLALDKIFKPGDIVAFAALLGQIYGPLQALTNAPIDFATSMVSFERVFEIIDLHQEIAEKPNAYKLTNVRGEVVFDHVSFSYAEMEQKGGLRQVDRWGEIESVEAALSGDDSGKLKSSGEASVTSQARAMALTDISFTLKPGQLAALVGPSGAGKTTISYLLPRLYDPTAGRVLIDGHDLRDVTLNSLADAMGVVTQETYLFHDTIRTNLLYARPEATAAEVEAAARAANIHDFIMDLPNRYDTIVGERGYRLSGGEKQRIAIARVILKDPRVLVLDEATSHLDSQSEALIQSALERVMKDRTSIVIAHRLSTILAADVILVLDRGQIVEQGSHSELIAQGGLYASLYETQFKRENVIVAPGVS
ncbi:MAG TPA: ABC transporter ATP-binding protein [Aggregatilineales bacterium]|nr:ABC transporter ATP-binding protein [Aggregatilineales bacterium]